MSKIQEHAGIQIPIYYYEDDDGNKVYDFEEMANEFEHKLSELDESAVVMCSVKVRTKDYEPEIKTFSELDKEVHEHPMGAGFAQKDVKHFADGFHEGNWEKD